MSMTFFRFTGVLTTLFACLALFGCQKSAPSESDLPTEDVQAAAESPTDEAELAQNEENTDTAEADEACNCGADCDCDRAEGCNCAQDNGDGCGCAGAHNDGKCACGAENTEACGCHKGDHEGHEGHSHGTDHGMDHGDDIMDLVLKEGTFDASKIVRQPDAKVGDLVRCPVSGEAFVVTDAHPYVDYQDKQVYFCCPGCIRRFQRNPETYLEEQR